jgi:predicted metal-dependent peptidase
MPETVDIVDLITQFRMATNDTFPYLSPYIYSLTPVERPGLGTMAVDKYGRLYYDPAFCDELTLEQGAYVVLHEATHIILRHCHRAESIIGSSPHPRDHYLLNVAMDIVVWEFLEALAKDCPADGVTFDKAKEKYPGIERNMTVEQLFSVIREQEQQEDSPVKGDDFGLEGDKSDERSEQEESSQPPGESQVEEEPEAGQGEETEPDERGTPGDQPGKAQGSDPGDGKRPGDFDLIGGGSGADGIERDYEEEPDPRWDSFVEDGLLQAVEKKIEELENDDEWRRSRGTIPSELKRVIRRKLHPKANPWDRLRATVSKAAANPKGFPDYTYRRPNRRQQGNDIRLKGLQKYSPKAAVVVDTSGSMTSGCLAKALGVIKQGLRALGQVPVITCDAKIGQDQVMTAVHDDFEFVGGGGTDMRVPLA